MLNYLKKFAVDIFPSVAATVIGAYIVNHYIVSRPSDAPPVATAVSSAKPDGKAETKPEDAGSVSNVPAAGVKAKGISEKSIAERGATEKAAVDKPAASDKHPKNDDKVEAKGDARSDANKSEANKSEASKSEVKSTEPTADGPGSRPTRRPIRRTDP